MTGSRRRLRLDRVMILLACAGCWGMLGYFVISIIAVARSDVSSS